jgi:hypothetical protein
MIPGHRGLAMLWLFPDESPTMLLKHSQGQPDRQTANGRLLPRSLEDLVARLAERFLKPISSS